MAILYGFLDRKAKLHKFQNQFWQNSKNNKTADLKLIQQFRHWKQHFWAILAPISKKNEFFIVDRLPYHNYAKREPPNGVKNAEILVNSSRKNFTCMSPFQYFVVMFENFHVWNNTFQMVSKS